jgi:cyanate lyase
MKLTLKNILNFNGFLTVLTLAAAVSCSEMTPFPDTDHSTARREGVEGLGYSKVLIVCCEGYNNLSSDIKNNISQIAEGYLPAKNDRQALIVYEHNARGDFDWTTPTAPVIYHMYDHYGQVVRDTIKTWPTDAIMVSADMIRDILTTVKKEFPSPSYGLLYSSHSTGWLPTGYSYGGGDASPMKKISPSWIGAQFDGSSSNSYSVDIKDFAEALPVHLSYIVFDCCLMGGVETTYDLRNKVDYIIASPTEVMSYGYNYHTLTSRLLAPEEPDLQGVCEDFYDKLASSSYLTVGLYDCSQMDTLARACRKIFDAHPDAVLSVNPRSVQSYNYSYSYHYDFRDIIAKMGAGDEELAEIDAILSELVLYKAATPTFITTTINPDTFSGISMYLPSSYWPTLNSLYRETAWNQDTHLLQ